MCAILACLMRLRSFLIEGVQKKMPRSTIADTQSKTKISKNRSAVQNKIYDYDLFGESTIPAKFQARKSN